MLALLLTLTFTLSPDYMDTHWPHSRTWYQVRKTAAAEIPPYVSEDAPGRGGLCSLKEAA